MITRGVVDAGSDLGRGVPSSVIKPENDGGANVGEEGTPMLSVVPDDDGARKDVSASLDEIVREGARRMLVKALDAKVASVIEGLSDQVDETGHRLVCRNGHALPRNGDHRRR